MDATKAAIYLFVFVSLSVGIKYYIEMHHRNMSQLYQSLLDKNNFGRTEQFSSLPKNNITLKEGGSTICKSCKRRVPNVILQYGSGRTATTLQFHILCLMMIMVHEDDAQNVGCDFNKLPPEKYKVIKSHNMLSKASSSIPPDSWVFLTSNGTTSTEKRQADLSVINKRNLTNPYVADLNLVLKRGYSIAYEYQTIFGITDKQMTRIVEYLRFWDILRVCCGKQSSRQWKKVMITGANNDPKGLAYPACEMYNISQVEKLLLQSYMAVKFANASPSLKNILAKPSIVDGTLDGSYCERFDRKIKLRKPLN